MENNENKINFIDSALDEQFDANEQKSDDIESSQIGNEERKEEKVKTNVFLKEIYEWTQAIAIAVVFALIINQFIFAIVQVNGSSMVPTLENAERLVVRKFFYKPDNKDIVIVKSEAMGKYLVKRVIATEGQVIDIVEETGDVYVDGVIQNETYIAEKLIDAGSANEFPLTIPEDCVFVMGDNRNNSLDSRALGVVKNSDIVGKASFRIWPFDSIGGLYKNVE